ncbi:MAG: transposase, partial [Selenomonadaceae bacterium]|nr:transposase [Selenomonadaceae bacterium]
YINRIMDLCLRCPKGTETSNPHLMWFRRLLMTHIDGIIAHATYRISDGKIDGINNKIKTLSRQAYGYPDDEYFFLNLIDMSRH